MEIKNELFEKINQQFTIMSTQTVMRSQTIARKLNINSTDLETIEVLLRLGRTTAGILAKYTGLTTGAITGVIDRLVKADFARREFDPKDRRKVFVIVNEKLVSEKIYPLYSSLVQSLGMLSNHYTENELNLIVDFLMKVNTISEKDLEQLNEK